MGDGKQRPPPLRKTVRSAIRTYLADMDGAEVTDLHRRLMAQVEPPLIKEVLRHTGGNQSKAARILGLTRNTLRARIDEYAIKIKKKPGRKGKKDKKGRKGKAAKT